MSRRRLAAVLALCWAASAALAARRHHIRVRPQMGLEMDWTVDYRLQEVDMAFSAEMSPSQWLGIGFSDRGEMAGADLHVLWVDWKRRVHVQHAWVDDEGSLSVDTEQDLLMTKVTEHHNNRTGFQFRRRFNTCHPRDYIIERGTTHVVWVTGPGPLLTLDKLRLAGFPSGFVRAELLRPELAVPPLPAGARHLDFTSRRVAVPAEQTTYWCTVHKLPAAFSRKHHVIQYEAILDKGNVDLVHHMEVFHCEAPVTERIPSYEGPCHAPNRPPSIDKCKRVLAAWAMGADPLVYPQEAGLPVGGADFNPYVMLEVHYNNPELKHGRVDSSGVRLTYTGRLRPHDASVMELGLEYTDKMAIPPGQQEFELAGYCVPECTAVGLPAPGIRVFASQLHTHLTGVAVRTEHVSRDGTQLPDLNRDNHYSSHFQEIRLLPEHRAVMPGDALITRCRYKTTDRNNVTLGGFAITDEMCVNYIHYFPKVNLEVCKSSVDSKSLTDYFEFMKRWEDQPIDQESPGWGDKYKNIRWNKLRSYGLHQLYESSPLSMQCNQSNGDRFAGYWERTPLPTVRLPLQEKNSCPIEY